MVALAALAQVASATSASGTTAAASIGIGAAAAVPVVLRRNAVLTAPSVIDLTAGEDVEPARDRAA
jgi:hypothetical protein